MRSPTLRVLSTLFAGSLVGCGAANQVVPNPTNIELDRAMIQVITALRAAENESKKTGTTALGLDPCTVTVTFNITASGTDSQKIVLDASATPNVNTTPVSIGVNASAESTLVGQRGNTITILLTSPACNPPETLGTLKPQDIATLAELARKIRESGGTILSTTPANPTR